MKFLVLSLLVVACSALPSTYNYGTTFSSAPAWSSKWSSGYGSSLLAAPRVGLVGLGGYSGGYSGNYLSSNLFGGNYLRSGYGIAQPAYSWAAAPAYTASYAAPAISYAAAPAIQVAAAPTISYAAAPVAQVAVQKVAYAAAPQVAVQSQAFQSVVPAAINQVSRTVEYRAVNNVEQPINPQVIEVEPSDNPVHLHFKTRSSTLSVSQAHTAAAPQEVQTAAAQDEPARLITEVQKPVIQEVREVISPYRQVTQEINPVQESLHTVVTKGDGHRQQYVAQQYVPQQQQYATVQAAPAIAVQQVAAAPAISYAAAPVAQAVHVEAAPVAVATQVAAPIAVQSIAAPAFSTGYTSSFAAPVSTGFSQSWSAPVSTGYSQSWSAPVASSSYLVQKPALIQKQVSIEKPAVFTSHSSSSTY